MNKLNIGRCSRCLASRIKVYKNTNENKLFCYKYLKYCQGKSAWCNEPPDGISKDDLDKIKKQVEIMNKNKLIEV